MKLYDQAIESCKTKGHALVPQFFNEEETQVVLKEVEALIAQTADPKESMFFVDDTVFADRKLVRVERIWEAIPSISGTELGGRLIEVASSYFGQEVLLFKDKVNIRRAGSSGYAPHQDSAAGWDNFADHFLTLGVFLHKSSPSVGGFEVVDRAHRMGRLRNDKGKMSIEDFQTFEPYGVCANEGDVILLDSEAPHRTLKNDTSLDSLHLLFTFAKSDGGSHRANYYAKKAAEFEKGVAQNEYKFRVFSFE